MNCVLASILKGTRQLVKDNWATGTIWKCD